MVMIESAVAGKPATALGPSFRKTHLDGRHRSRAQILGVVRFPTRSLRTTVTKRIGIFRRMISYWIVVILNRLLVTGPKRCSTSLARLRAAGLANTSLPRRPLGG